MAAAASSGDVYGRSKASATGLHVNLPATVFAAVASGALEAVISCIGPLTSLLGMPPEALPMALLRPLSGSGAYGVLASIIQDPAIGPDSYAGYLVSTIQGSTETTFYVLAVYFGAVQIRRIRHALVAALCADFAGIAAAVLSSMVKSSLAAKRSTLSMRTGSSR